MHSNGSLVWCIQSIIYTTFILRQVLDPKFMHADRQLAQPLEFLPYKRNFLERVPWNLRGQKPPQEVVSPRQNWPARQKRDNKGNRYSGARLLRIPKGHAEVSRNIRMSLVSGLSNKTSRTHVLSTCRLKHTIQ